MLSFGFASLASATVLAQAGGGNCSLSPRAQEVIPKLKEYMNSCRAIIKKEYFAINDYTSDQGKMILVKADGTCHKMIDVSYGKGSAASPPQLGNEPSSHKSPIGCHVSLKRDGAKYSATNSLLMGGLQGQGSAGRGIRIHQVGSPGGANTLGCAGVASGELDEVMKLLDEGSLVYNLGNGDGKGGDDFQKCEPEDSPGGGGGSGGGNATKVGA